VFHGPGQPQGGLATESRGNVRQHVEDPLPDTGPPLLRHALQLEDRGADLADRVVEIADRADDAVGDPSLRQSRRDALQ
jgi:hypothetical protein